MTQIAHLNADVDIHFETCSPDRICRLGPDICAHVT